MSTAAQRFPQLPILDLTFDALEDLPGGLLLLIADSNSCIRALRVSPVDLLRVPLSATGVMNQLSQFSLPRSC
jgi:hypothetical protein